MHRVYADFTYKSGSTTVSTRVADLLERRTGVCQDFTHFMVSGLRSLGLAGRYVSGYLATRPPPARSGWSAPTPATPGSAAGYPAPAGSISIRRTTG